MKLHLKTKLNEHNICNSLGSWVKEWEVAFIVIIIFKFYKMEIIVSFCTRKKELTSSLISRIPFLNCFKSIFMKSCHKNLFITAYSLLSSLALSIYRWKIFVLIFGIAIFLPFHSFSLEVVHLVCSWFM
jgi:hypothetical protein